METQVTAMKSQLDELRTRARRVAGASLPGLGHEALGR